MNNQIQNSISAEIVQIPSKDNEFTAIVKASCSSSQGSFQDFGIASASSTESKNNKYILEEARKEAFSKVEEMKRTTNFETTAETQKNEYTSSSNMSTGQSGLFSKISEPQQKTYNHNPNKPISDSQKELLHKLAPSPDTLKQDIAQKYNKSIENLNSFEANECIQKYKKK